jgi:hypothetical protein
VSATYFSAKSAYFAELAIPIKFIAVRFPPESLSAIVLAIAAVFALYNGLVKSSHNELVPSLIYLYKTSVSGLYHSSPNAGPGGAVLDVVKPPPPPPSGHDITIAGPV